MAYSCIFAAACLVCGMEEEGRGGGGGCRRCYRGPNVHVMRTVHVKAANSLSLGFVFGAFI